MLASPDQEVDEEKAIGWSPHSPELDLVDYRKLDMQRVNTDEIVMTVRFSQYSEACGV